MLQYLHFRFWNSVRWWKGLLHHLSLFFESRPSTWKLTCNFFRGVEMVEGWDCQLCAIVWKHSGYELGWSGVYMNILMQSSQSYDISCASLSSHAAKSGHDQGRLPELSRSQARGCVSSSQRMHQGLGSFPPFKWQSWVMHPKIWDKSLAFDVNSAPASDGHTVAGWSSMTFWRPSTPTVSRWGPGVVDPWRICIAQKMGFRNLTHRAHKIAS
jgi:hypothetical protein